MKRFTPKEDKFIKENYLNMTYGQIANKLNRATGSVVGRIHCLGLKIPQDIILQRRLKSYKHITESGKASRFKKGHIPANKGKKMDKDVYNKIKHTFFSEGHTPANTKYFGKPYLYVREHKKGYIEKTWMIQESVNKRSSYMAYLCRKNGIDLTGKKPRLKPGFEHTRAPTLNDMIVVSNNYNMKLNSMHNYPRPLVKLIQIRSALIRQINKIKKHEQKNI